MSGELPRGGRLGLVPPRYGDDVVGGAETVLREMAHAFTARGWEVEVLTTCARDHFTWDNSYPEGESRDGGVLVRRFRTEISPEAMRAERARLEAAVLAGTPLSNREEQIWMNGLLRVPDLFHHLMDHASDYRALVFMPYLFWTTFACSQVAPERSILVPCLHDEPYARLRMFKPMFEGVRAVWFLTEPEAELANHLFHIDPARQTVIGSGLPVPTAYDPDGFRERHGIEGRFLLYAGRREGGKSWDELLAWFASATKRHGLPFQLVTMGVGEVHPPSEVADRVLDLGFLPDSERNDAFAAADAYLQPSRLESFSRTIMEAWLAGTLVIANEDGEVVRWHCERSGAGLTYRDEHEFAQCLSFLSAEPETARQIAARGREYVLGNYTWPEVIDRVEKSLEELT